MGMSLPIAVSRKEETGMINIRASHCLIQLRRIFVVRNQAAMVTAVVMLICADSSAQVRLELVGAVANVNGNTCADEWTCTGVVTPVSDNCADAGLTSGLLGHDFGIKCFAQARDEQNPPGPFCPDPPTFMDGQAKSSTFVDGDNTQLVSVSWKNLALCQSYDDIETVDADSHVTFSLTFRVTDPAAPPGTPVIVYYSWDAFGGATTEHDCPFPPIDPSCPPGLDEDMVSASNTLLVNGADVLAGRFNLGSGTLLLDCNNLPLANPIASPFNIPGFNKKTNQGGVIASNVGSVVIVAMTSDVESHLRSPVRPGPTQVRHSEAIFNGTFRMSVGHLPPPPLPAPLPLQYADFSVDIGSDREISDDLPPAGPRLFDPGDCYQWNGPSVACVEDGIRDDATIFAGVDQFPLRTITGPPPACPSVIAQAPVCVGPWLQGGYFDLDAHDALEFSLANVLGPNLGPVSYFQSDCIDTTDHLAVSFDDDGATLYADPSCSIPARSDSPILGAIYGTTARRDEVVGIETIPLLSPPRAIPAIQYPIADEVGVHSDLAPNPDLGNNEDDDVDSLDMTVDPTICNVWYFSSDHEATGFDPANGTPLDPGVIYQAVPGGLPVMIVHPQLHLGLVLGVDIDAFEFVWLYNDRVNAVQLALLFSVDDDDPFTPGIDESGGLDPRMIYGSFMDGVSFPFLTSPLADDIDAISTWRNDLLPPVVVGACCEINGICSVVTQARCLSVPGNIFHGAGSDCADVNQNGAADVCECPFCRGDVNGDQKINGLDVQYFLDCILNHAAAVNCGCSDIDGDADVDLFDVQLFSSALLLGPIPPCP